MCPPTDVICYLEGLLAGRGVTHCVLLALLPAQQMERNTERPEKQSAHDI